MAPRLVTVFGGSGFVGRYVVQEIARTGARVRVAVRRPNEAHFLKPMGDVGQVVPVQANIRNELSVARALHGADAVVNLVGILHETHYQSFNAVHHRGAATIAGCAAEAEIENVVHLSAIGADADSPAEYARSKAAGEAAVRAAIPAAAIIRPSIVFGPEDDFFNRFATMARIAPALPLVGGGETRFQPVYVDDVAAAVVRVLTDPALAGQTFELGGPNVYTFRALMELMIKVTGQKRGLVPLSFGMARAMGRVCEMIPLITPPITRNQVEMLRSDNVCSGACPVLSELGINPASAEAILPTYLWRYRKGGQFADANRDAVSKR